MKGYYLADKHKLFNNNYFGIIVLVSKFEFMKVITTENEITISRLTEAEKTEFAIWLYQKKAVSAAKAASLAELDRSDFMKLLSEQNISIYREEDLTQDLNAIGSLNSRF